MMSNYGMVELVDWMPHEENIDFAVVQAARVSYGKGIKSEKEDRNLIRYLMRHRHTTPFEMIEFKFRAKMPIFVARQWIRHRTASVNEYSGRYSEVKDEFYVPTRLRKQSKVNKQGSDVDDSESDIGMIKEISELCYKYYQDMLSNDVAKELARIVLPLNYMTEWYWKIDLHNLLHFLNLRCDEHAQEEIRWFANCMLDMIRPLCPVTIEAWEDYSPFRKGMLLSRLEILSLANDDDSVFDNEREKNEWILKKARLKKS